MKKNQIITQFIVEKACRCSLCDRMIFRGDSAVRFYGDDMLLHSQCAKMIQAFSMTCLQTNDENTEGGK